MKIKERGFSKPDKTAWFLDIFKLNTLKLSFPNCPSEEGYKESFPTKYYLLIKHKSHERKGKNPHFISYFMLN